MFPVALHNNHEDVESHILNIKMLKVKDEPQISLVPIKKEKNEHPENNKYLRSKLHREMKQECILHDDVMEEEGLQYYTNNKEKIKQDPLAINDNDTENFKREQTCVENISEEYISEVKDECKYEDNTYKIDIEEHRVGSSDRSIYEDNIQSSSSIGRERVSVTGGEVSSSSFVTGTPNIRPPGVDLLNMMYLTYPQNALKGKKTYACNECPKSYSHAINPGRHTAGVHKGIKNECQEYKKTFSNKGNLKTHIKTIHGGEKKECPECHKMISHVGNLRKHIDVIHRRSKKHQCNLCLKMFSTMEHLKRHIKAVHEGVKTKCAECSKKFSQLGHLRAHINSAHKGMKNECLECNKVFTERVSLRRHMDNIHKKIKTECPECDEVFSDKRLFEIHINSVHKGFKNKCPVCKKVFSLKGILNRHVKNVHNKINN